MKAEPIAVSAEKLNGRFYTPKFIVNNVLDLSGYHGQTIFLYIFHFQSFHFFQTLHLYLNMLDILGLLLQQDRKSVV